MRIEATLTEPRWKLALYLVVLLAIGFAAYQLTGKRSDLAGDSQPATESAAVPTAEKGAESPAAVPASARVAKTADEPDSGSKAAPDERGTEGPKPGPEADATPTQAAAQTGQQTGATQTSWMVADELLTTLADLTLSEEILTDEQVRDLRHALARLAAQGEAAIPAIREFLQEGADLDLAEMIDADARRDGGLMAFETMRLAVFDVLRQIGGPQTEAVMHEELQQTRLPLEVGALADYLEEQSPGSYGTEAVAVARDALDMANEGQLEGQDVGPLFHVLESYGDADAVAELEENLDKRWGQYAIIALGGVAEGEGVPVLMERVEKYAPNEKQKSVYSDKGLLALQALTQVSTKDFAASKALIDKARADQIPAHMWAKIASVLAGDDQVQIKRPEIDLRTVAPYSTSSVKKYPYNKHRMGIYTVYTVHNSAQLPQEEVMARLNMVDQLLEATEDPEAKKALRESKRLLTGSAR